MFGSTGAPAYTEAMQGDEGSNYLFSAMSAVAERPDLIKAAFITQEKNAAGIIEVRFYIRGKPWVVTMDDRFLFMNPGSPKLKFAQQAKGNGAMWGPILEKAWAKVKGSYTNS